MPARRPTPSLSFEPIKLPYDVVAVIRKLGLEVEEPHEERNTFLRHEDLAEVILAHVVNKGTHFFLGRIGVAQNPLHNLAHLLRREKGTAERQALLLFLP